MGKKFSIVFLLAIVLGWLPGAGAAPSGGVASAATVVERLHSALLDAMRGGTTLGYEGRLRSLAAIVDQSFDFPTISRIVTGAHWEALNPQQKALFELTFRNLSISTYASKFDAFSGERFETLGTDAEEGGRVEVRTRLLRANGEEVTLSYVLQEGKRGWRIVNVIADGVSDLSLKRADYTAVLQSSGFDPLIGKLNEKIANNQNNSQPGANNQVGGR
jgi:phospholipid transport system substrate-binding protein